MVGENWEELAGFLQDEAWNAFKHLEPKVGDIPPILAAIRRDLGEVSEFAILTVLSLGWQHCLIWLSDESNRERLEPFVGRSGEPWLAWWTDLDQPPPPSASS